MSQLQAFHELCLYTLVHGGAEFIHQHVVDAFAAQDAQAEENPIRLAFALVGLYLHLERGFTGREVQRAHMQLARNKEAWPRFPLPHTRGEISATTVLAAPLTERDAMIHAWCRSVWTAFTPCQAEIVALLARHGIQDPYSLQPGKRHRS